MEDVINRLEHWVQLLPREYNSMSEAEISIRPSPNKWSKKEILGHLCDSAINNIERFVKIQYVEQPYIIQSYDQERWVVIQNYQERPIDEILNVFQMLNNQIINIVKNIPIGKLTYLCDVGETHKTLEWLIQDYLNHMEHHIINQILINGNK